MNRRNFIRYSTAAGAGLGIVSSVSGIPQRSSVKGEKVFEVKREVPVKGEYDVIVCGGGPAGSAAAIEAARNGARTMLIENNGCLGGVWTSGSLTWILDYHNQKGILKELTGKLTARGAQSTIDTGERAFSFDLESMKMLLDELCTVEGIRIRFHTRVCNAVVEKGRITHVITESKSGREAWKSEIFIDATGDGDLAAQAGCSFDFGDPQNNNLTQPFSLLGIITGIEFEEIRNSSLSAYQSPGISKKNFLAEIQAGGYDPSYQNPSLHPISHNLFKIMCNHQYGYSSVNADDVTKATLNGRHELWNVINALKKRGGPWKNIRLISSAEQIGTREGRRIHGHYTVTVDDLIKGNHHPDAIAEVRFGVDVHSTEKKAEINSASYNKGIKSKPYTIPLRALIARDVEGLLLAGRCISGDFIAHSSYRVTGPVTTIGQAAGRVAALSAKMNILPQDIKFEEFGFPII
jgi:hypothetical protein